MGGKDLNSCVRDELSLQPASGVGVSALGISLGETHWLQRDPSYKTSTSLCWGGGAHEEDGAQHQWA